MDYGGRIRDTQRKLSAEKVERASGRVKRTVLFDMTERRYTTSSVALALRNLREGQKFASPQVNTHTQNKNSRFSRRTGEDICITYISMYNTTWADTPETHGHRLTEK